MRYCAAILFIIMSVGAHAAERPEWTYATPKSDGKYKCYVGRALEEASEKEAWRVAKDLAQETAVRENFGVETSIATSSYESANHVALDKRVSELFPKVRLIDFEQVDSFVEKSDGKTSVWIFFKYPLHQIESERARLKNEVAVPQVEFNEVGKPELTYSTVLEVSSEPLGIPVFVNSERWGVTPLRVAGVLATGVHKIKLSHDNFQDLEGEVILVKGVIKRIHHKLKPAMGYLKISAVPNNVEILIDGVSRGFAPVGPIQVLVTKPIRVEARSPDYETQIQVVEVQKDEIRRIQFALNPIRRRLAAVDDASVSNSVSTGSDVDGHQRAWIFGFFLGHSGTSAPAPYGMSTSMLGLTLEKRFWSYFGLRAGASLDFATEETKTSEVSDYYAIEGTGNFIGLPVYFTSTTKGIYVMPEIGSIRHKRIKEEEYPTYEIEPEFIRLNATRKGVRAGYINIDSNIDLWVAVHKYDWRELGMVQTTSVGITFTISDGGK
jgi:hypothetical protein